jgi:hypothetical protein
MTPSKASIWGRCEALTEQLCEYHAYYNANGSHDNTPFPHFAVSASLAPIGLASFKFRCGGKEHAGGVRVEKACFATIASKDANKVVLGVLAAVRPIPNVLVAGDAVILTENLLWGLATSQAGSRIMGDWHFPFTSVICTIPFHQEMTMEAAALVPG